MKISYTTADGNTHDLGEGEVTIKPALDLPTATAFKNLTTAYWVSALTVGRMVKDWARLLLIRATPKSKPWQRPRTESRRQRLRRRELHQRWCKKRVAEMLHTPSPIDGSGFQAGKTKHLAMLDDWTKGETPVIFVRHQHSHAADQAQLCTGCQQPICESHIAHNGYWHYDCAKKEAARRGERWM